MPTVTEHGVSGPARYIAQTTRDVIRRQQDAVTFSRQPAFDALWVAWHPCRNASWDGEGANPIELDTFQTAYRLIEAMPNGFPVPTIHSEPDGNLQFEWYRDPRRLLSVSICPDGMLYWAALVGLEDPRGSCQFFSEFPKTLLYWIGRVCR